MPVLTVVLASCNSGNSPQAECERQADQDPAVRDWWWSEAQPMIESRRRFIAGDVDAVDAP